jgi:hypothetical protein
VARRESQPYQPDEHGLLARAPVACCSGLEQWRERDAVSGFIVMRKRPPFTTPVPRTAACVFPGCERDPRLVTRGQRSYSASWARKA